MFVCSALAIDSGVLALDR